MNASYGRNTPHTEVTINGLTRKQWLHHFLRREVLIVLVQFIALTVVCCTMYAVSKDQLHQSLAFALGIIGGGISLGGSKKRLELNCAAVHRAFADCSAFTSAFAALQKAAERSDEN